MSDRQPGGQVSRKWYSRGYQQGMKDIKTAHEQGGEAAVLEWLASNLITAEKGPTTS